MTTFAYAAYGSNLHPARLKADDRCPSAKFRGTCIITGRRLTFRKCSKDASAKCDANNTGNSSDELRIAVFDIPKSEEGALDRAEGLDHGYHKDNIELTVDGQNVTATIYLADDDAIVTDAPYGWYKQMVLLGAEYHRFPEPYLRAIRDVVSKTDTNESRARLKWDEVETMRAANNNVERNSG